MSLSRAGMDRMPADEEALQRIGENLIAFMRNRILNLRALRLVDGPLPRDPATVVSAWPGRARNVTRRTGLAFDTERLRSATVGDLLDVPTTGVQTVLEIAALLETSALFDPERIAGKGSGDAGTARLDPAPPRMQVGEPLRWGEPCAPLLPETLRSAFADETLPAWLRNDLKLPDDASPLALDANVWSRIDRLPSRASQYLIGLLTYRSDEIRDVRVLPHGWAGSIRPDDVAWPNRISNALTRAGLMEPRRLGILTFGELLAVRALGVKSALEFAVLAEATTMPAAEPLDERAFAALLQAADEPWADRIRATDPRFRDVVPPYPGSLSELFDEALTNPQGARAVSIVDSLPAIRARVSEIDGLPLDVALGALLKASGISDRDAKMVMRRLGWGGGAPATLQEVGDEFAVTRERVRQVVARALGRLAPSYMPKLETALELVYGEAPITVDAASELLVRRGISSHPLHPPALASAADALGYDVPFDVVVQDGVAYGVAPESVEMRSVLSVARREVGKVGMSNLDEIRAHLESEGSVDASTSTLRRFLGLSPRIQFLVDDWFWMPGIPADRNRLRNVTRRLLAVTPCLALTTIRQGVRRRYRFMRIDLVPPLDVLRSFYDVHPEFIANDDAMIESVEALDYRQVLGDVERTFVEALRGSPTGLMDRAELEAAVVGRGVNSSTFSVFTTYSPILDHPAMGVWCLRGQQIEPTELEALRGVLATRTRPRRTIAYGWQDDGTLAVTSLISSVNSPVIGIPRDIARYVAGRHFSARTRDGISAGNIAIDDLGASWGYGPFLRRRGAEPGDALTVAFELTSGLATLSLGDETELDEPG